MKEFDRKLVLEDGSEYYGYGFGSVNETIAELVFNTSMVGYQEILSDPSYAFQAVVMTYPLIGNYGMTEEDYETSIPMLGALIVGENNQEPSNFRSERTLDSVMKQYRIPGICGIDTRKLTRAIRDHGSCKVMLCDAKKTKEEAFGQLTKTELPSDAVSIVSCKHPMTGEAFLQPRRDKEETEETLQTDEEHRDAALQLLHVAAIDCGMKQSIVRSLQKKGCKVTVLPYDVSAEEIRILNPDGLFISNGPGNPEDVPKLIQTVKELHGEYPMFGICLGHQIICLSYGAVCYKLKFGHRGGNHPVMNLETGKIEITSQNHSYAVDQESLEQTPLQITHRNLLDHTVEGVKYEADQVFSVQYHPESAPGPEDSMYLFDQFIRKMEEKKYAKAN